MTLVPGIRLGHYEITSLLGKGGMGEVYLAKDIKLDREVAVKVLPPAFSENKERLARFEREARLLASLNHPNIATIHELVESEGMHFLALEYVPGKTLSERIESGPIPVKESLALFTQIAEGLEAAHERGVIHRDLKPANIKVTPEGKVKILDFGLAKALSSESPSQGLSESPTLTRDATETGVVLGTAPYMSPEQARGEAVDKKTDIWAFGCCLYEALTTKATFLGETVSDTIAGILKQEPDWQVLPQELPVILRSLLRQCLNKDQNQRLQHIGDARIQIDEALAEPLELQTVSVAAERKKWQPVVPWILTGVIAVVSSLVIWTLWRRIPPPPPAVRYAFSAHHRANWDIGRLLAISPDGTNIVYGGGSLYDPLLLRPLNQLESAPVSGTKGGLYPFFSPDGKQLGFFADGKLNKVPLSGGTPIVLCEVGIGRGGSWGAGGTIVFNKEYDQGLVQISASGGTPEVLTTLDTAKGENSHRWPQILPGGKAVLFTIRISGTFDDAQIAVQSLKTGETRILVEGGTYARYVSTGHLVFVRGNAMLAVPFDLERLEVTGAAVAILDQIDVSPNSGNAAFAVSDKGHFIYSDSVGAERKLVWVDRQGNVSELIEGPQPYRNPRLSPNGRQLVVTIGRTESDIWLGDIQRGVLTRLTFGGTNHTPIWMPRDDRVLFSSARTGPLNLYYQISGTSGSAERFTESPYWQWASSYSPDGRALAFTEYSPVTGRDIWLLPVEGERDPMPFLQTPFDECCAIFSHDGRWLAYASDESGRREAYVQPYSGPGTKVKISTDGGDYPLWSPNGRELFYRMGSKVMSVAFETKPTFTVTKPRLLFEDSYVGGHPTEGGNYDVSPDGERFVMIEEADPLAAFRIQVVLNWFEELEQLVPKN